MAPRRRWQPCSPRFWSSTRGPAQASLRREDAAAPAPRADDPPTVPARPHPLSSPGRSRRGTVAAGRAVGTANADPRGAALETLVQPAERLAQDHREQFKLVYYEQLIH